MPNRITAFKNDTGRKASENPLDNFWWRFVVFATKTNKNPKPALQIAGKIMPSVSLPIIIESLKGYFERLNARIKK